jgi:hypothetical protein
MVLSIPPAFRIIPSRQEIVKFLTAYSIILTNRELSFRRFYNKGRPHSAVSCGILPLQGNNLSVKREKIITGAKKETPGSAGGFLSVYSVYVVTGRTP